MTTTNDTSAFFACPPASLTGCFYNAQSVMALAFHHAKARSSNIVLVCSGEHRTFALDDAYCAGTLAEELVKHAPDVNLHESVYVAFALCQTCTPTAMLDYCRSAQNVRQGGMEQDLHFCLMRNVSANVAQVMGTELQSGLLILEPSSFHDPLGT